MNLSELFTGRNDFESKLGIIECIRNSSSFNPQTEDLQKAEALLIFSTSKQHTWLVCTRERLYCILDDIRKDRPHIVWSMGKQSLISNAGEPIAIGARDKSEFTGLVDIGEQHRNWLYTKRLFASESVENQIRSLIERNISIGQHSS